MCPSLSRFDSRKGAAHSRRIFAVLLISILASVPCAAQTQPGFDTVEIGAFDADAWNGLVFLAKAFHQPAPFALRVGSQLGRTPPYGGTFLDGGAVFAAISEVGPHAPDGSYSRMSWRQPPREARVTLEWSRVDQTTVVGRLTADPQFHLVLETYFPDVTGGWGTQGSYSPGPYGDSSAPPAWGWGTQGFYAIDHDNSAAVGERFFDQVFGPSARFVVMVDQPLVGSGIYPTLDALGRQMQSSGKLVSSLSWEPTAGAAGLEFSTGQAGSAHFVATLGWDRSALLHRARTLLQDGKIDSILSDKSEAYAKSRPVVSGLFEGAAEAIGNSTFWNTVYAPSNDLIFPSISRFWAHRWNGWATGAWDIFFGSLLMSLEDKAQTEAAVKAILLAQTPSGLVPNVASGAGTTPDRSNPPIGSYAMWKEYQRFGDRQMLSWAYPRLKKWHEWWFRDRGDGQPSRDGNRDGLLEWGSDRGSTLSMGGRGFLEASKLESGMDDSPMYDDATYDPHAYTMNLADVGLNSLYALDAECLSKIAAILGEESEARTFADEYVRTKELVQAKLWNEVDGIYENRFWDGRFSKRLSPTNFYPLVAGIATPMQARRMVEQHLLNPKEFWGEYVLPSIARNDPAFGDQFYWRGGIWGPTNYMVYEGLGRYRFDKIALEFAQKSYNLFWGDWKRNQYANESYFASGGNGRGDTHYTWGALLCLIALEQYVDTNPWEGLRFGALSPPLEGEFRGVHWQGHVYDVAIGPKLTKLVRDGAERFEAEAGVVVRNYQIGSSRVAFTLHTEKPTRVITMEFNSGTLVMNIDRDIGDPISVSEGRASFIVPAGEHTVELRKQ
jgi:hypothetical protein